MLNVLKSLFKELLEGQDLGHQNSFPTDLAIACLLVEVANADHNLDTNEQQAKVHLLTKLCQIPQERALALLDEAEQKTTESASLYEFTSQLRTLTQEQRFELITSMWKMANADGIIDPLEDSVIRKTAELLYVGHSEFIRAKLQACNER